MYKSVREIKVPKMHLACVYILADCWWGLFGAAQRNDRPWYLTATE